MSHCHFLTYGRFHRLSIDRGFYEDPVSVVVTEPQNCPKVVLEQVLRNQSWLKAGSPKPDCNKVSHLLAAAVSANSVAFYLSPEVAPWPGLQASDSSLE